MIDSLQYPNGFDSELIKDLFNYLFADGNIYGLNALSAIGLAFIYYLFFKIFRFRRADTASFFLLIAWGWLINFVYVIFCHFQSQLHLFSESFAVLIELSICTVASFLFFLGARNRLKNMARYYFNNLYIMFSLFGSMIILSLLEYFLFSKELYVSIVFSVIYGSLAIFFIGYSYYDYFGKARKVFSNVTIYSLIISMYCYSAIQFGYLLKIFDIDSICNLKTGHIFFVLGMSFKLLHIYGLGQYSQFIFADYAKKVSSHRESKIRSHLFDQLAHELSTPAAELRLRLTELETKKADWHRLHSLVEQISGLIMAFKKYRLFDRAADKKPSLININNICDAAFVSLKMTLQPVIRHQPRYCAKPMVKAVEIELFHILQNIYKNAIEATANVTNPKIITETSIEFSEELNDSLVFVKIIDNGGGIDDTIIIEIFEDGFSTKAGSGRGHGLWIAKSLIEKNEGSIRADNVVSEFGLGALFEISLPYFGEEEE